MNKIVSLFLTFAKIGTFTFGGGYGMIALIKEECHEKRNWIEEEEFINMIAVSESTPGPIAVNMATYIGFKNAGILGAISATLGVIFPSIAIIYLISLFFHNLLSIDYVDKAFKGIRIAVGFIIIRSAVSLIKDELKHTKVKNRTIFLFAFFIILISVCYLMNIHINTVHIIIIAVIFSLIYILGGKKV